MDAAPITRILFVCTGNVCRSPVGEHLLAHKLDQRGVPARVSSAGLVLEGSPASSEVVELLGERGIDGTDHVSRIMDPEIVADADLVLGMTREHVREAVLLDPSVFDRAFTVKELVRRGRAVGPRGVEEPLAAWIGRAGAGRPLRGSLGSSPDDDVRDPMGSAMSVHREVAAEIDELIGSLVDLAWPAPVVR